MTRRRRPSADDASGAHAPHPSESSRLHKLRDGRRVLVRPVLQDDREELAQGYDELSPESRHLRFGSAPDHLSPEALVHLVDLDYDDRFALAAFVLDDPGEPGVGVARYSRLDDDHEVAEAAVTVLDAYQGLGIGTILLRDLVEVALAHGITTLTATVLWENEHLLDALQRYGATVEPLEPGLAAVRAELH